MAAEQPMQSPNLLIFIPTYNEAQNAERLCPQLSALGLGADILFCDDGSPDSTGEIVGRLAHDFLNVRALHRPPEISLLNSRDHAREVVDRAGFNLVEYYFGMRDLLVQGVLVGCKQ
jgi:glycosyltransferase involved in cell wall biosynthesis